MENINFVLSWLVGQGKTFFFFWLIFFLLRRFDINSQKLRVDLSRYLFQHTFKTTSD